MLWQSRAIAHHCQSLSIRDNAVTCTLCDSKGLGLGNAKYAQLQAVLEMGRRHLSAAMKTGDLLTSPDLVRNYLSAQLRHQPREVFAVLFLDNQNRLITYEELFFGTIDGASVYPREVVRRALAHNCAAVILSHNHPSGVAEPSQADYHLPCNNSRRKGARTPGQKNCCERFRPRS